MTLTPTKTLLAEWHLDTDCESRLRLVKSDTERFVCHDHDYFELFLVLSGRAVHLTNDTSSPLSRGDLVFMRHSDIHDYTDYDADFSFINLAFSADTLGALFTYLGEGFPSDTLLSAANPPSVRLTDAETQKLYYRLTSLAGMPDEAPCIRKTRVRTLLAEVFPRYFAAIPVHDERIPFWLEHAYEAMKQPKNFVEGKERLFTLAGKTREHTTRCMKQYYGMTPSDYINDLRLTYAAGLLRSSNYSVTDICFECGFGNVSWFYTSFEKKFGVTPLAYKG